MAVLAEGSADTAENWDDDFEFQQSRSLTSDLYAENVPRTPLKERKTTLKYRTEAGPSTPTRRVSEQVENWDDDFRNSNDMPVHRLSAQQREEQETEENWDADFEGSEQSPPRRRGARQGGWGSSDEEVDNELGFLDREEDRTVTSRIRGMPLSIPHVPPVPPLPSPFPRSPTTSVFSVPGSSQEHDAYYSSTTHIALRRTISGASSALALLPPRPPIQRERRRLRKKSRPHTHDIFELEDRTESSPPRPQSPPPSQPATPEKKQPHPSLPSADESSTDNLPSTSTRTPLLSRIGSVGKKWSTARRKRASTGPAEITLPKHEHGQELSMSPSLPSPPPSATKSSWFFRSGGAAGPGPPPAHPPALKHESSIDRLIALIPSDCLPETPPRRAHARDEHAGVALSLPRELSDAANGDLVSSATLFGGSRGPVSMQMSTPASSRHASYGYSMGKKADSKSRSSSKACSISASASTSAEDFEPKIPTNIQKGVGTGERKEKGKDSDRELEKQRGSRSFMGGMRRISLVSSSKHRRGKSTVQMPERPPRPPVTDQDPDQVTPRPPERVVRSSQDSHLPPIDFKPPASACSPTYLPPSASAPAGAGETIEFLFHHASLEGSRSYPALSKAAAEDSKAPSPRTSPASSPAPPKMSTSAPQVASLGRATQAPKDQAVDNPLPPRRNSLGDLKIPARISQAQINLRRDLEMVRDFATSVEQLKQLRMTYHSVVNEVQELIESSQPAPSRAISPTFFHLPKPVSRSRPRSNTNPPITPQYDRRELSAALQIIETKYQIPWECAELLVDLGSGAPAATASSAHSHHTSPLAPPTPADTRKSRERAITLTGDESKRVIPLPVDASASASLASPPSSATGGHELSQRQLLLLREMLNNSDSSAFMSVAPHIPKEGVNRHWRWGDAMNSTITLPSEGSTQDSGSGAFSGKKQWLSMRQLRDILRSIKRSYAEHAQPPSVPPVPVLSMPITASTESSLNLPSTNEHRPPSVMQRGHSKTSISTESMKPNREQHPNSPYGTSVSLTHRVSPRRPSLASIFRLGQKSKSSHASAQQSADDLKPASNVSEHAGNSQAAEEEQDWDCIESASDLGDGTHAECPRPDGAATVRLKNGTSPYITQQEEPFPERRSPSTSQSSLRSVQPSPHAAIMHLIPSRRTKLSNAHGLTERSASRVSRPPSRNQDRVPPPNTSVNRVPSHTRKNGPSGSLHSAPSYVWASHSSDVVFGTLPDPRLAMTPENIQPLLENAREVHARCTECIIELRALLTVNCRTQSQAH